MMIDTTRILVLHSVLDSISAYPRTQCGLYMVAAIKRTTPTRVVRFFYTPLNKGEHDDE